MSKKKTKASVLLAFCSRVTDQRGIVAPLVAGLLIFLIGFTALAIDVGYYMVTRNELQNIADAAALAACGELGEIYRNLLPKDQLTLVFVDKPQALIDKAQDIGQKNKAGELSGIVIRPEDIIIGTWDGQTRTLTETLSAPDAVKVIARRDNTSQNSNSPITTFFARVFDINEINVEMDATAALTGQSTTEPGEIELPVGISSYFFQDGNYCNDYIVFNPTNDPDSCAGWHSYDLSPPNDNLLRQILNSEIVSPHTVAGDSVFEFIGGNLSNPTFDALLWLFGRRGYDTKGADTEIPAEFDAEGNPVTGPLNDNYPGTVPFLNEDGTRAYYPDDADTPRNYHRWETTVPVYDWIDCSNPNTAITIVGFTRVVITDVLGAPEKKIVGKVLCDQYSNFSTRGGGGNYGLKGTIPGLVE
jgi:hypothetical protein